MPMALVQSSWEGGAWREVGGRDFWRRRRRCRWLCGWWRWRSYSSRSSLPASKAMIVEAPLAASRLRRPLVAGPASFATAAACEWPPSDNAEAAGRSAAARLGIRRRRRFMPVVTIAAGERGGYLGSVCQRRRGGGIEAGLLRQLNFCAHHSHQRKANVQRYWGGLADADER